MRAVQSFFRVRTLKRTMGRLALLMTRELLRRRRLSSRASGEKKCLSAQAPVAITATPSSATTTIFKKFMDVYLAGGAPNCKAPGRTLNNRFVAQNPDRAGAAGTRF